MRAGIKLRGRVAAAASASLALLAAPGAKAQPISGSSYLDRSPEQEILYFVLPDRFENGDVGNDRGHLRGGRLDHGFDPQHKGFYHGGDLKGLTRRLDYIV